MHNAPFIAHCIVGEARGFVLEGVWRSILEKIVESLGGVAHVFLFFKIQAADEGAAVAAAAHRFRQSLVPQSKLVTLFLKNKSEDKNVPINTACPPHQTEGDHRYKFSIMAHDQSSCFDLVLNEERQLQQHHGRGYSLVLKYRPDERFCSWFPPWQVFAARPDFKRTIATFGYTAMERSMLRGGIINDRVAVMHRSLADRYFSANREVIA